MMWLGKVRALPVVENIAKEPQSFFYCGSFDHLDLHSLKRLHIVFFGLPTQILRIGGGGLIHSLKGRENTFPAVYYMPNKIKNTTAKQKRKQYVVV